MIQQWNHSLFRMKLEKKEQIKDQNKGEFDKIRKECNIRNNTAGSR